MTDPREERENRDELDLDAETVRDLELTEDAGKDVRGGRIPTDSKNPCTVITGPTAC